jgi:Mu-like prophage tail sheath protein gpL
MTDLQTTSFSEVPYDWRKPGNYMEVRPNYQNMGLVDFPAKAVLFVQMLATGTAEPKKLYQITRKEEGSVLFGAGSVGADMVSTFKGINRTNAVYAIALPDVENAEAASGSFEFTGEGGSGNICLYIDDTRVRIPVSGSMSVADIAVAAAAAINKLADLPVTATAEAAKVTLTAKHKGGVGNGIMLSLNRRQDEVTPKGIIIAVTPMSGGNANPELKELLDVIANEWFTDIAIAWNDAANLEALAADLKERYTAMGRKDGHGYCGSHGTFGEMVTKGNVTNAPQLSIIGGKNAPSASWKWAAALCAIATFQLTNDPARQLRSLAVAGLMAPATEDRFTEEEQDLLLRAGISTFNVLDDGTVTLDRIITTYKKSNLGVTDTAWLDIMVPKTMTRLRYDWAAYVSLTYPRHKLADDDSVAAEHSDAVVTPKRMHGSWGARCQIYERKGWIERSKETVADSAFWRSTDSRDRMEARQRVIVIGNMMVFVGALEFDA